MLPGEVTLIPQFMLFQQLGWLDTYLPLIVPSWFGGGAFYIFLLRQFFMTIPRDLDEAAKIDGASSFRILWQHPAAALQAGAGHGRDLRVPEPLERLPRPADLPEHDRAVHARARAALLPDASPERPGEPKDHLLMAATVIMTAARRSCCSSPPSATSCAAS